MTTNDIETGPDGSPREHWTSIHDAAGTTWHRHTWPAADATDIVAAFLAGTRQEMTVLDENGKPAAHLIDSDCYDMLTAAAAEMDAHRDAPKDTAYHPAVMGPGAGGDDVMLIDTDSIRDELLLALTVLEVGHRDGLSLEDYRARLGEAKDRIRARLDTTLVGCAVQVAWKLALNADDAGMVPIRMVIRPTGHNSHAEVRWQLAYQTPVRGLYVRMGAPGIFGDTWTVVTGSGYSLRAGFDSREIASSYAEAIATTAPGLDWRIFTTSHEDMTPELQAAIGAENRNWQSFGRFERTMTPAGETPA
jgi:hypothetical protein